MKIEGRLTPPSFRRRPESRGVGAGFHYRHLVRSSLQRPLVVFPRRRESRGRGLTGMCASSGLKSEVVGVVCGNRALQCSERSRAYGAFLSPRLNSCPGQGLFIVPKTAYRHSRAGGNPGGAWRMFYLGRPTLKRPCTQANYI